MVIFTTRRTGMRPYTVGFWRGVNMDKFFPFHGRVDANYDLLPHHHREVYIGAMFHYPVGGYGMGPDIVSEFVAWICSVCLEMHHRFTLHEILLNNGEFYKVCVGDLSSGQTYDPNGDQTPSFATFYPELQDPGVLQQELFKRHCHHCRTQHWYAMKEEMFLYNVRTRCVCEDDPPNSGVLAAVRYSKLLQYPVPGGHQEQHEQPYGDADRHQDQDEAQVNGGVHNHNADNNHGGHQDQDEPEVNGDAHNHNADDDHEGHQDQDQDEPEQVNGDAHNHDADDNHAGNQDQDEAQVNGDVHNHNADDGHQDQEEAQVNGDAQNHDADDNHEEAQVNGDAHNHDADDNHEGHQDQDESQVNGDAHNHNVDDNHERHQDQDESQVNGDVHNQDAEGNHGVHQDQGVALVNGNVHNHNADGNNGGHGDQDGEQVNGNGHNQLVPMIMERVPTMIVLLVIIFMLLTFKSSFLAE